MLDHTLNQPTKFRRNNWIKTNDETSRTYNTNSQIKFNTSILRSILCDYSEAYVLVSVTITVPNTRTVTHPDMKKKKLLKIVLHLLIT